MTERWRQLRRASLVTLCTVLTGCGRVDPRWPATKPASKETLTASEVRDAFAEVESNPRSARARYALGVQYYRLGYLRDASAQFRRALELDPQNPDALMGLWQVGSSLNDTAGIVELAAQASQLNPNDPRSAASLRDIANAFEKAAIGRRDPWLLVNAALCLAKLREWDKAETFMRQAVSVAPNVVGPRLLLATLFLDQGMTEQATLELQKLTVAFPKNALAHEALGRARRAQHDVDGALEEFQIAQKLRPSWIAPWMNAGDIYLYRSQYDLAEAAFKKAREIEPHSLAPGLALVQAYAAAERYDESIDLCEKMLADFPGHIVLLNNLAYCYAQAGQHLDRAVETAEKLAKANPANPIVQDTLGWVYFRSGRNADAVTQLKRTVVLAPDHGAYSLHLAQAQLALNLPRDAAASLRTALAAGLTPADEKLARQLLASH